MAKRDDLSTPRGTPGGPVYDPDTFARLAERLARFLGTGRYLAVQTGIVVVWIFLNGIAVIHHWDPYPFILLNLAFSTQAAYAAPLILLAQNRQADRDKHEAERDREMNARSLADTDFLAREMAAIRLALEHKADRDDVIQPIERLAQAIERLQESGRLEELQELTHGSEIDDPAERSAASAAPANVGAPQRPGPGCPNRRLPD